MRILITTIVDPKKSTYSRMHAFAQHLSKQHKVVILSVNDSWKGSQAPSKSHERDYEVSMTGVDTVFITDKKKSIVSQELFSGRALKKLLDQMDPFDIIIDYNTLSIGRRVQRIIGDVNRIYDLADDLVDMIRASPQLPRFVSPFAARYAQHLINKSIKEAKMVTGTTGALLERYRVPEEKRRVIPNGIPSSFLMKSDAGSIADLREETNEFLVGYVGVLREWIDFIPLFETMKRIRSKFLIRLTVIGEEGDKESVQRLAEKMGVAEQVSMVGTVPHNEIREYLAGCDCGIVPFAMTKTSDFALPLKVFEYFSAGLPIISTPIRSVKENFPTSIWFYDNAGQLEEAILSIHSDKEMVRTRVSEGMKKVESEFTWDVALAKLDDLIRDLVRKEKS